jgi:transposase
LEKVESPEEVIDHRIPEVCRCGCNLDRVEGIKKNRQVFDIPKPRIRVTEHVTYEKAYPDCGTVHVRGQPFVPAK